MGQPGRLRRRESAKVLSFGLPPGPESLLLHNLTLDLTTSLLPDCMPCISPIQGFSSNSEFFQGQLVLAVL